MNPNDVAVYFDDGMLAHEPTGWDPEHPEWTAAVKELLAEQYPDKDADTWTHPERPERVTAIRDRLTNGGLDVRWRPVTPADARMLQRVHSADHVAAIEALRGRSGWLAVDTTAVSPASVDAALLAAGAGVSAVEEAMAGSLWRGFCLVRPPGHHALHDRAMGFCLFNNVAVAAAHARDLGSRVLVYDWDLHHGNGTQAIFYDDPDVLFVDTHCAAPFYPGTGLIEETGDGPATGTTINVPLPAGSGNAALLAAFDRIVAPAAHRFGPDLILVSAGFDLHHLDQTMMMNDEGFGALAARMTQLADSLCGGRLVMMLEGGYHADALAGGAEACVRALAGESFTAGAEPDDPGLDAVNAAAAFHGL